ncbi:MAG TPA: hypothetical protein VJ963_09925 [Bacteroidales bacterium]|nr:hypothetical protein [Bacteroidales bacterium]
MKRLIITCLLLFPSITALNAQVRTDSVTTKLEKLYNRLVNSYQDSDRIRINDSIYVFINSFVHSDSAFTYNFTGLKYLGQITSPDSLVKIITWNILLSDGQGKYFSYFIRKKHGEPGNIVYSLSASYSPLPVADDTTYNINNWYGALYYGIRPVSTNGEKYYMLLGINYGNPGVTRKMIDVLEFKSDTTLSFGRKWFSSDNGLKYRVVLEYSATAMVSLRFKSDTSVVFDHLVPFSPAAGENRQYYGPEYTYDAYIFDGKIWKLKINVDARNKE